MSSLTHPQFDERKSARCRIKKFYDFLLSFFLSSIGGVSVGKIRSIDRPQLEKIFQGGGVSH